MLLLAAITPAPGQTLYYRTDLGALGMTDARGLNNLGQVVGGNGSHALLYSGGVITDIGALFTGTSIAVALNDSGQVVVRSPSTNDVRSRYAHVFLYDGGAMNDLGTPGDDPHPTAINNNGDVIGRYNGYYSKAAFLYRNNGGWTNVLGPYFSYGNAAYGINGNGQIALNVLWGGYLVSDGQMTAVGFTVSSQADTINESGEIVGWTGEWAFDTNHHAFLYSGGVPIDLGTLGGTNSKAYAINNVYTPGQNHGQVVGTSTISTNGPYRAFIYSGGTMTDLNFNPDLTVFRFEWDTTLGALMFIYTNSMIPGDTDLTAAIAINDEGQILCSNGILLTPKSQIAPIVAKLYWANGEGIENRLSDTPIFWYSAPGAEFLRKNGASPPVHVPALSLQNRPPNATHVLLVLSTDDLPLEINTNNNVAALDLNLPDLLPASIAWNQISGTMDFSYTVQPGNLGISSTTAKLYWANGPSVANKISNSAISTQTIPAGFSGQSQIFSVPAASFQSPPANATHVLLVVDPDNLITESSESNNIAALNITLPDLLAASIALNQNSGSVDFSYAVQPGTFGISSTSSTTAKLFWANGTSITNKLSDSAIFTQNILAGFSGQSLIVSVPSSSFQPPPTNATHVLLVVDPDNLITESSESNNVLSLRTALDAPIQDVEEGANVTSCVTVSGLPPLNYQWLFNGTNLVGQTQRCLTLTAVTTNQAGNYTVVICNSFGCVTSAVTRLVVIGGVGISGGSGGSAGGDGLLLYLPMNGNAEDASGNGRHGEVSGATLTTDRFGETASAYAFNGSSSITVTNLDPDSYTSGFSFGAWIRPDVLSGVMGWGYDASWGSTFIAAGDNTIYFRVGTGNPATDYSVSATVPLHDWSHFFVTHAPTNDALYVNGQLIGQWPSQPMAGNISTFQIGASYAGSFTGAIDEVAVFGRGLSSNEVALIYNGTPTTPKIMTQPQSRTSFSGATVTFTVSATGTTPLAYQWRKAGVNLNNETNAALTFSSVVAGDAGNYDVVVTNNYGSVTSIVATLTVVDSQGPAMDFAAPGGLSADASYSMGFEFDTLQPITVTALGIFDDGTNGFAESHDVGIFNTNGLLLASTTVFNTNQLIGYFRYQLITPLNLPAASGYRVAAVTGTEPFTWSPSGATTNALIRFVRDRYTPYATSLVLPSSSDGRVGYFGANFLLTVSTVLPDLPVITTQPTNQSAAVGATATFTVAANGAAPLAYQWRKDGVNLNDGANIGGVATATLGLTNVTASSVGSYDVVVTNSYGSVTSQLASLTVLLPPLRLGPVSHSPDSFATGVSGTPGETVWILRSLKLVPPWTPIGTVTLDMNGTAMFIDTNPPVSGAFYQVSRILPALPVITTQPTNRNATVGATATFTVAADSAAPLGYLWRKGGVALINSANLSGATGPTLSITDLQLTASGDYDVVVTNYYGSVTSQVASLTIVMPASGTPAMDFTAPGGLYTDTSYSMGFEFDVLQPITITALGIFDDGTNGFAESHDVGIFSSNGTLLASTTVYDTNQLIGYFRYQQITPLNLPAGSGYRVAAVTGTERYTWSPSGTTTNELIRFVRDRYTPYQTNLVFPTSTYGVVGYFGANVLLTTSTNQPP